MRLSKLHEYMKERFPKLEPAMATQLEDGKEVVHVDFKVVLSVNFDLDNVNEETIFQDVAGSVRQALYQIVVDSQDEFFKITPQNVEAPKEEVVQDDGVEIVADEDRKVIL